MLNIFHLIQKKCKTWYDIELTKICMKYENLEFIKVWKDCTKYNNCNNQTGLETIMKVCLIFFFP